MPRGAGAEPRGCRSAGAARRLRRRCGRLAAGSCAGPSASGPRAVRPPSAATNSASHVEGDRALRRPAARSARCAAPASSASAHGELAARDRRPPPPGRRHRASTSADDRGRPSARPAGKRGRDALAQLRDARPRASSRGSFSANVMGTVRRTGTGLPSTLVTSYSHWRAAASAASSKGGTLRITSAEATLPVGRRSPAPGSRCRAGPAACASGGIRRARRTCVRLGAGTSRARDLARRRRRRARRPPGAPARGAAASGQRAAVRMAVGAPVHALRPRSSRPRRRAPPWRRR